MDTLWFEEGVALRITLKRIPISPKRIREAPVRQRAGQLSYATIGTVLKKKSQLGCDEEDAFKATAPP
jgi:hypothetical protein